MSNKAVLSSVLLFPKVPNVIQHEAVNALSGIPLFSALISVSCVVTTARNANPAGKFVFNTTRDSAKEMTEPCLRNGLCCSVLLYFGIPSKHAQLQWIVQHLLKVQLSKLISAISCKFNQHS